MDLMRAGTARLAAFVVAAAAVVVVVVVVVQANRDRDETECEHFRKYVADVGQLHEVDVGVDSEYSVLGDSITAGDGLDSPNDVWVYDLAVHAQATVVVDAIGETGFINRGPCGDHGFESRVDRVLEHLVGTVLVQGGTEDVGEPTSSVEEAATAVIEKLKVTGLSIVVIGPVDAPALEGEEVIDRVLARATRESRVQYISMVDVPLEFQSDGIHLSREGQDAFASAVVNHVAEGD